MLRLLLLTCAVMATTPGTSNPAGDHAHSTTTWYPPYDLPEDKEYLSLYYDSSYDSSVQTLNSTEEIIRNTSAADLLDTYTNDEQRDIIHGQLKYCPFTSMCRVTLSGSLPDLSGLYLQRSCCSDSGCSCNFSTCVEQQNCCPDLVHINSTELPLLDTGDITRPMCIPDFVTPPGEFRSVYGLLAIAQCPPYSDSDSARDASWKCAREYTVGDLSFADVVPVTDNVSGITYRNQFCALCNNMHTDQLIYWDVYLKVLTGTITVSSETDAINSALEQYQLILSYVNPATVAAVNSCILDVISTCNVTGFWTEYNERTERACLFYSLPYKVDERYYGNVFCAICNGHTPQSATCPDDFHFSSDGIVSFSVLLKTSVEETSTDEATQCESGYVEDKLKGICQKLHCRHMKWLSGGKCQRVMDVSQTLLYTAMVRMTPKKKVTMQEANLVADEVITWFSNFAQRGMLLHSGDALMAMSQLCGAQLLYIVEPSDGELPNRSLHHYDIRLQMEIISLDEPDDIIDQILFLENSSIPMALNETGSVMFNIKIIDYQPESHFNVVTTVSNRYDDGLYHSEEEAMGLPLFELIAIHDNLNEDWRDEHTVIPHIRRNDPLAGCESVVQTVRITHARLGSCPVIKLAKETYNWNITKDGIYLTDIDQEINDTEFIFEPFDTVIVVCADTFSSKVNAFLRRSAVVTAESSAEGILTIVSLSVSLLCLVLAFATFCLFPILRTLPGKNNMALIATIFMAQTMFIIGMYAALDVASTVCKVLGLCIHFFWLLALMWMNVCTLHVFRLFALTPGSMSRDAGWKSFFWYTLYSVCVSCVFVLVNVVVSLVTSDMSDVGYGGRICYISDARMVGYTFGIPVGLVVTSNLCMFLSVVIKIKQAPKIEKNVKNQRNDIVVFAKLSSLTGASWLFGLLFDWSGISVFSYLFILLNASQGLFLLLAFVCNQRVLNMYKSRMFGGREFAGSMTPSMKDTSTTVA